MGAEGKETEGKRGELVCGDILEGVEIAKAFAHLAAFYSQEFIVHPEICHGVDAVAAFALGYFVLVMNGDVVDAAGVDVELGA